jgi:hypothetical protein
MPEDLAATELAAGSAAGASGLASGVEA